MSAVSANHLEPIQTQQSMLSPKAPCGPDTGGKQSAADRGCGSYITMEALILEMPPGMRSRSSIMTLIRRGQLPFHKFGRTYSFSRHEVEMALHKLDKGKHVCADFIAQWKEHSRSLKKPHLFGRISHVNRRKL